MGTLADMKGTLIAHVWNVQITGGCVMLETSPDFVRRDPEPDGYLLVIAGKPPQPIQLNRAGTRPADNTTFVIAEFAR